MKSTLQILLVALVIGAVLAAPVAAATAQGLEWSVDDTDRFNYSLTSRTASKVVSERIFIDVDADPVDIPNIVTAWGDIPYVFINKHWENETPYPIAAEWVFWFLGSIGNRYCVPIGNYTLLTELAVAALSENVTVTTGYYYWTVKYTGVNSGNTGTVTASYLKTDGFLAKYLLSVRNATVSFWEFSIIRDALPNDIVVLVMDNILFVAIGVIVIIVIGAVVCKKR